jgi:hypothetical protein
LSFVRMVSEVKLHYYFSWDYVNSSSDMTAHNTCFVFVVANETDAFACMWSQLPLVYFKKKCYCLEERLDYMNYCLKKVS